MSRHTSSNGQEDDASRPESLPICKLRGVSPRLRRRLARFGITRCDRFLEALHQAGGVAPLARRLGVEVELLADLAAQADMSRIVGIGSGFARLLEEIGIRTTRQLALLDASELWRRLRAFNQHERICRRTPNIDELRSWIGQARRLQLAPVPL